jgi:hypothetical protein
VASDEAGGKRKLMCLDDSKAAPASGSHPHGGVCGEVRQHREYRTRACFFCLQWWTLITFEYPTAEGQRRVQVGGGGRSR